MTVLVGAGVALSVSLVAALGIGIRLANALHRPEDDFDPPQWVSGRKGERS